MKKALLYSLVGLSFSSISFVAHASCEQVDSAEYVNKTPDGVCLDTQGLNITIKTPITVSSGDAVKLNDYNNVLRVYGTDITGNIDGAKGSDELVLSEHNQGKSTGTHTISGDMKNVESIETTDGTWDFTGNVELSADAPSITELTLPWKPDYSGQAPGNTPEIAGSPTVNLSGDNKGSYPHLWEMSKAHLIFHNKLMFKAVITKDTHAQSGTKTIMFASHITAGTVDLQQGYGVNVDLSGADPKVIYKTNLIDASQVTDSTNTVKTQKDGNWTITTTIDGQGLHLEVKAPGGVLPTPVATDTGTTDPYTDSGVSDSKPTLNYEHNELTSNDDITFAISNTVAKYRTDSVVSHDAKFLDFSVVKNSGGAYQNLSLIEGHLNISRALTEKTPLLHNTDDRNFVNLQVGYYHGYGKQGNFRRYVNAYTIGSAIKMYNPFTKKDAGFLKDIWLSTGLDVGFSQQYDIARQNADWDQYTTEGKENDLFLTNTYLTGIDLYGHFKYKNGVKLSVTPYTGIGFTFIRLGNYSETAKNPLAIDSQYRLKMYGIFGVHAQTLYKLNNGQTVGFGANFETNLRFNNKGNNRKYSYTEFQSADVTDNDYKRLPMTFGLNANYMPRDNINLFTKISCSSQELYNYNLALGMKVSF